jgi:hypothetical protein
LRLTGSVSDLVQPLVVSLRSVLSRFNVICVLGSHVGTWCNEMPLSELGGLLEGMVKKVPSIFYLRAILG